MESKTSAKTSTDPLQDYLDTIIPYERRFKISVEAKSGLQPIIRLLKEAIHFLTTSEGTYHLNLEEIQRAVSTHLPVRNAIREMESPIFIADILALLEAYQQFALALKPKLSSSEWANFCKETGKILFAKGYYATEAWLTPAHLKRTESRLEKQNIHFQRAALRKRIEANGTLREYFEKIRANINYHLTGAQSIASERVATSTTAADTRVSVAVSAASSLAAIGIVPGLGTAIHSAAAQFERAHAVHSNLTKKKNAAKTAAWVGIKRIFFIEAIAFQLAESREEFLDFACLGETFFEKNVIGSAEQLQQGVKLTPAERIAVKDADIILHLMEELDPPAKSLDEEENANRNAKFLFLAFIEKTKQKEDAKTVRPRENKKTAAPEILPLDFLPHTGWYWQQLSPAEKVGLPDLSATSNAQILADEKIRLQQKWKKAFSDLLASRKPDSKEGANPNAVVQGILSLQSEIVQALHFSLQWEKTELTNLFNQLHRLWAASGLGMLSITLRKTSLMPWSQWQDTHTQILSALNGLSEYGQTATVQLIHAQYDTLLLNWMRATQEMSLQKKAESKKVIKHREEWAKILAEWQAKLDPLATDPALAATLANQHAIEYAKPEVFSQAAKEALQKGNFEPLRLQYDAVIRAKDAAKEKLSTGKITTATIKALNGALFSSLEAAQKTLQLEHQAIVKANTLQAEAAEAELQQVAAAQKGLKPFAPTSTTWARATQPASHTETTGLPIPSKTETTDQPTPTKRERKVAAEPLFSLQESMEPSAATDLPSPRTRNFWDDINLTIHAVEQEMGPPPCGFSVVGWNTELPGILRGNWRWGIVLEDATKSEQEYWHVFMSILDARLAMVPGLPAEMRWPGTRFYEDTDTYTNLSTDQDDMPYRYGARQLALSQTQTPATKNLFKNYKNNIHIQLTRETEDTSKACQLGYEGLQFISTLPTLPIAEAEESNFYQADTFLKSLVIWCQQIAIYYHIPPSDPQSTLLALKETYLHPAFIADVQAAFAYAQAYRAPASAAEKIIFNQHYKNTLQVLKHSLASWSLTQEPKENFDPMEFWLEKNLLPSAESFTKEAHDSTQQENRAKLIHSIVQIILHRSWQKDRARIARYFKSFTPLAKKLFLAELELQLAEADASLIEYLRYLPLSPAGERFYHADERAVWEHKKLPLLWKEGKSAPTATTTPGVTAEPSDLAQSPLLNFPVAPVSPPRISIARYNTELGAWVTETHLLSPEVAAKIFTKEGDFIEKDASLPGSHLVFMVTIEGQGFAIKFAPEQPANEFLVKELAFLLDSRCVPAMELVKIHYNGKTSAALITEAVEAENLNEVMTCKSQLLNYLAFEDFIKIFLLEIITNPEDNKPEHYFLVPNKDGTLRFMRIDNDRAFFQATRAESSMVGQAETLQVKTVVYCLEQMRKPWKNSAAVADFLSLDPFAVTGALLERAQHMHGAWNALFTQSEVDEHYDRPETERSYPCMHAPEDLSLLLISRIRGLQNSISAMSLPAFQRYPLNAVTILELSQPKLAKFYVPPHPLLTHRELKRGEVMQDPSRVYPRFVQVVGSLYKKDEKQKHISHLSRALAVRSSVSVEAPITKDMLPKIRAGTKCSPAQELSALKKLAKKPKKSLQEVQEAFSTSRPTATVYFQELPLGHKIFLFRHLKQEVQADPKKMQQKSLLLQSMIGGKWLILDLHSFDDQLVTNDLFKMMLQEAGDAVREIDISGCRYLTPDVLRAIQYYCPNLKKLRMNDLPTWGTVHIGNFAQLDELEMNNATFLRKITFGDLPRLKKLSIRYATVLEVIGNMGFGITSETTPWQLPSLQHLDTTECSELRVVDINTTNLETLHWTLAGCEKTSSHSIFFSWIDDGGAKMLGKRIENSIKEEGINGICFICIGSDKMASSVISWLEQVKPYYEEFRIVYSENYKLSIQRWKELARLLKTDLPITYLIISNPEFGGEELAIFLEGLKKNHSLVHITFDSHGAEYFFKKQALTLAIENNYTLRSMIYHGKHAFVETVTYFAPEASIMRNCDLFHELFLAIHKDDLDKIRYLLKAGIYINSMIRVFFDKDKFFTPLVLAVKMGNPLIVAEILKHTNNMGLKEKLPNDHIDKEGRFWCAIYRLPYACQKDICFSGKSALEAAVFLHANTPDSAAYANIVSQLIIAYRQRKLPLPEVATQWLQEHAVIEEAEPAEPQEQAALLGASQTKPRSATDQKRAEAKSTTGLSPFVQPIPLPFFAPSTPPTTGTATQSFATSSASLGTPESDGSFEDFSGAGSVRGAKRKLDEKRQKTTSTQNPSSPTHAMWATQFAPAAAGSRTATRTPDLTEDNSEEQDTQTSTGKPTSAAPFAPASTS